MQVGTPLCIIDGDEASVVKAKLEADELEEAANAPPPEVQCMGAVSQLQFSTVLYMISRKEFSLACTGDFELSGSYVKRTITPSWF